MAGGRHHSERRVTQVDLLFVLEPPVERQPPPGVGDPGQWRPQPPRQPGGAVAVVRMVMGEQHHRDTPTLAGGTRHDVEVTAIVRAGIDHRQPLGVAGDIGIGPAPGQWRGIGCQDAEDAGVVCSPACFFVGGESGGGERLLNRSRRRVSNRG